jgi:hypothetical protein
VVESGSVWNDYTLGYMARLLPLPRGVKGALLRFLVWSRIGSARVRMPLGNLYLVAKRT